MANKKKTKSYYMWQKIIPRLSVTMYLSIYSIHYFDIQKIKPWLRLDNTTLRVVAIFIAYILASYFAIKDIKYHKTVKLIYILNALMFLLIMCI